MKRIILPHFYVPKPKPDPEDRFAAILPEDLSPEARAHLIRLSGYRVTEKGKKADEFRPGTTRPTPTSGLVDDL